MRYLPVEKKKIPYTSRFRLAEETFDFTFRYNSRFDFFTVDLYKRDQPLVLGEKIVYGLPLFWSYVLEALPKVYILPFDVKQEETTVHHANLMESVFLYVVKEEDLGAV